MKLQKGEKGQRRTIHEIADTKEDEREETEGDSLVQGSEEHATRPTESASKIKQVKFSS